MLYQIPDDYNFKIHFCRPRYKNNVEDILIYMASEITRIGDCEEKEFKEKLDSAIRRFPGNANANDKTMQNWRTEVCHSLFGLYYSDANKQVHVGLRAMELAENEDLVSFFKKFLFYFQLPGGHVKYFNLDMIKNGIHFKPAQYFLKVLEAGERMEKKAVCIDKEEACYCILNDLRCTRDNQNPENVWQRIQYNRDHSIYYKHDSDTTRYAGDILEYMQIANLLVCYDGKNFYLNHRENAAILKFINSSEWFSGYDYMIKKRTGTNREIAFLRPKWFVYVNRKDGDTDFSTDISTYIEESTDTPTDMRSERMKSFASYLDKIRNNPNISTKDIGDIGEALVMGHEQERLKINGREDLVHLVTKISTPTALGYDISSRNLDASMRNIEVKTTISSKPLVAMRVHLTPNEWQAAKDYREKYFIYRLFISKYDIKLFIMNDPVQLFKDDLIDIFPEKGMDVSFKEKAGKYEELLAWTKQ